MIAAACALWVAPAAADGGDGLDAEPWWRGATASFVWENDIFGGTDANYTNGVSLNFVSEARQELPFTSWLADALPDFYQPGVLDDDRRTWRTGIGVGHAMFTPGDISAVIPDLLDRPYAGWLYLNLNLYAETAINPRGDRWLDTAQLTLGVVGPAAGAEWVQTNYHQLIDGQEPRGWDAQLANEPGAVLRLERRFQSASHDIGWLEWDAELHAGAALGNVETSASFGGGVRLGRNISADYGPPRIRPALGGSAFFTSTGDPFGWYVFAGVEGRGIAHTIFLDGNTFRDGPSVNREPFVVDAQTGVAFTYVQTRLSFTYVHRTEEFAGQTGAVRFGAGALSWRF